MRVASKLYVAFALYAALLGGVLLLHVRAVRSSVEIGRMLSELSSRLRVVSDVQPVRLADLGTTAKRFLATGDDAYRRRFDELARAHTEELARLDSLSLSGEEPVRLATLRGHWRGIAELGLHAAQDRTTRRAGALDGVARLELSLDVIRLDMQRMATATRTSTSTTVSMTTSTAISLNINPDISPTISPNINPDISTPTPTPPPKRQHSPRPRPRPTTPTTTSAPPTSMCWPMPSRRCWPLPHWPVACGWAGAGWTRRWRWWAQQ